MNEELVETVRALENDLLNPTVRHDRATLQQLLHEDFVEVGKSGRRWNKSDIIDKMLEQTSFDLSGMTSFELQPLHPDGSVVIAHWTMPGVRRISIWTAEAGHWQLRYHQGTPSAEV